MVTGVNVGATWTAPWLFKYHSNDTLKWRQQFAWWPVRSSQSNQRIWLKKCWYGYRFIYGPAGEEPIKAERWLTEEEYIWYQLTSE